MKGSQNAVLKLAELSNFIDLINNLIESEGATVSGNDKWMPKGLQESKELELKDFLRFHFSEELGAGIHDWWLDVKHPKALTPKWDMLSTCTIDGKRGLMLVEAKAHWGEAKKGGKPSKNASEHSKANHSKVGLAIDQANTEINKRINGIAISRDKCYQLSNRVAHAWWLANQGIPVVLLYLGILNCTDMDNGKYKLFKTHEDWEECFTNHSSIVGVDKLLGQKVHCGKSMFVTLCKSFLCYSTS